MLLFSFFVNAQIDSNITIGKKEVITSKILNENRTIWIYTPNKTSINSSADKSYPVLYVLDGDAHFYSTTGIVQQLSQANGALPEMIVVAIENTNRFRDFVPANDLKKTNPFVDFLSTELIPYIDKKYNTAPYKVLMGHSLAGLTAINMLTKFPDLFNAYIAIEPSMWYDNEKFLKYTMTQLPKKNFSDKRLFVATANTMPRGMTLAQLNDDKSPETQHMRSIIKLNTFLKSTNNGLSFSEKYYESEGHNTVPLIGTYDGLRFIFNYYLFDATEKEFTDTSAFIAIKLRSHYANISDKMGYKNSAPEAFIKYIAYEALEKKQFNKAEALFKLNVDWYPQSHHAYESYADYFVVRNDTNNAIINYNKALAIDSNLIIKSKIKALSKNNESSIAATELKKYTGVYNLEMYNIPIVLEIRQNKLWAKVPGQEDDELIQLADKNFTVKGKQGYNITFEMDTHQPKSFTSVQPNGTFKAVFVKK